MENNLLIHYSDVDVYQQEDMVLKDVNLNVYAGEFIYLIGRVGSGKSSLLKTIYCDLPIQNGTAKVLDYDLRNIKNNEIPFLRRKVGIVFQDFQLLTDRTVNENLEFVLLATGWKDRTSIEEQIDDVLARVGMSTKGYKKPNQLSGGEQQRIVIARALLNSPDVILADEPTGNIDPETGRILVELLYNIRLSGTTVIMATHNLSWIDSFPGRIIRCENGLLTELTNSVKIEKKLIEKTIVVEP